MFAVRLTYHASVLKALSRTTGRLTVVTDLMVEWKRKLFSLIHCCCHHWLVGCCEGWLLSRPTNRALFILKRPGDLADLPGYLVAITSMMKSECIDEIGACGKRDFQNKILEIVFQLLEEIIIYKIRLSKFRKKLRYLQIVMPMFAWLSVHILAIIVYQV